MKRILWILLAVAILVAAFCLLSFRVMSSRMARDVTVAASHQTAADGLAVRFPPVTTLRVEGNGRIEQSLRETLGSAVGETGRTRRGQRGGGQCRLAGFGAPDRPAERATRLLDAPLCPRHAAGRGGVRHQRRYRLPAARPATLSLQQRGSCHPSARALRAGGRVPGLISLPGYNAYLAEEIVKAVSGEHAEAGYIGVIGLPLVDGQKG